MQLPPSLLDSLQGIKGFNKDSFTQVHASGEQVTSVRFNPLKLAIGNKQLANLDTINFSLLIDHSPLTIDAKIPWSTHGYYLTERPAFIFDPLIHAGVYYVQEASSMFLEQALKQTADTTQPLRVLDLCAAPGGKSTLLQSCINKESLLVCNEVIKSRAAILEENMTKWGASNVIVTNNDPADFSTLENFFDVIVIDAPCSGSGLFRREPDAMNEWSEQAVQHCSSRQQRILAGVYPALKKDGILIYCTCSYSKQEDEDITDWMQDNFALQSLPLSIGDDWGIVEVQSGKHQAYGYRFFPDQLKGEGFFLSCFRKTDGAIPVFKPAKKSPVQKVSKKESSIIQPWLKPGNAVQLFKQGEWIFAFPAALEKDLLTIVDNLYVRRAGITIGKTAGDELIPHHALALSTLLNDQIVAVSLKTPEALQYLRKEDVKVAIAHKGWALVRYETINLGWIKIISNRVNNYYPKEWRILKSNSN